MSRGLAISLMVVALIAVIISIVLIVHHDKVWEGSALLTSTIVLSLLQVYMHGKQVVGNADSPVLQRALTSMEEISDRPLRSVDEIMNDYPVIKKKLEEERKIEMKIREYEEDIKDLKEDEELENLLMKIDNIVETHKNEGIEVTDIDKLLQQANKLIKNYKRELAIAKRQ